MDETNPATAHTHRKLSKLIMRPSFFLLGALLLPALAVVVAALAAQPARAASATGDHVDTVTFDQDVGVASAQFLTDAISTAESDGASALVIQIDTPGGSLDAMKAIVQAELASTVPIIVYVSPAGGRAASAGTFITLAASVAAMAPDTRIGAASPVDASGSDLPTTEATKVKNDLLAQIRSLQTTFGRAVDPAEQTVSQAASFTDQEALDIGLVDVRAATLDDLLAQVNGRSIVMGNGSGAILHTAGLAITTIEPTFFDEVRGILLDPTVLFVIFIVGAVCIYLEVSHPGAIVPGTVGAIAILLFLYGAGSLNPNWAGLGLMVLGVVLLGIDIFVPSHGVLTVGGLLSLALGTFIFFDTNAAPGAPTVDPLVILGVVVGVGLVALYVLQVVVRARLRPVTTGQESFIGQDATVIEPLAPDGRVRVQGEDWAARLWHAVPGDTIEAGTPVRVVRVEGLRLLVEPTKLVEAANPKR